MYADLEYGYSNIEILYTTEDELNKQALGNILKKLYDQDKIGLFAVNMCSTGHNFRSTYVQLDGLRGKFPNIPIMAVSARAGAKNEILRSFHLKDPLVIYKMKFDDLSVDDLFQLFDEWFLADRMLSKNGMRDKLAAKFFIDDAHKKRIKKTRLFMEAANLLRNKYM